MKKLSLILLNKNILRFFWACVLIFLPVTSFRFFPTESTWRPLAIFPALVLAVLLISGTFFGKKLYFPKPSTTILFLLILIFILSTFLNSIYLPTDYLGSSFFDRSVRAYITLFFGIIFLFVGIQMNTSEDDMLFSMKFIYISFIPVLLISIVQWLALFYPVFFDRWQYNVFHEFFMIKGLRIRRIIGFAYEPGWFADQLVLIYIPWVLMAFFTGRRIIKSWWLELSISILGIILLLFTYSRSGIFSLLIVLFLFFVFYAPKYIKNFFIWFFRPFMKNENKRNLILRFIIILIFIIVLILISYVFGYNNYFAKLWEVDFSQGIMNYLEKNSMSSRLIYAIMGTNVFVEHPIIGVGFGALGFYMPDQISTGLIDGSIEMSNFLAGKSLRFLNAKNMYVRMASETGIFGLVVFLAFLASVMGLVWRVRKNENQNVQFVGGAAFLIVTGIVIRFFTFDSFASPTIWVTLGIVVSLLSTVQSWNSKEGELKDE